MQVSTFLDESRDEIYAGWTKNAYRRDSGEVCLIGALDRVAMRHLGDDGVKARAKAQKELCKTAAEMFPEEFWGDIPSWNDGHATKQDVLDLLDKTALKCLERGE